MGEAKAERQYDLREVQQSHEVPLQAVRPGVGPHRAPGLPVRPQGPRHNHRQPQHRQGQI